MLWLGRVVPGPPRGRDEQRSTQLLRLPALVQKSIEISAPSAVCSARTRPICSSRPPMMLRRARRGGAAVCSACGDEELEHEWFDGWFGACYEGLCENCYSHRSRVGGRAWTNSDDDAWTEAVQKIGPTAAAANNEVRQLTLVVEPHVACSPRKLHSSIFSPWPVPASAVPFPLLPAGHARRRRGGDDRRRRHVGAASGAGWQLVHRSAIRGVGMDERNRGAGGGRRRARRRAVV